MTPAEYLSSLQSNFRSGIAREHAYRPAFAALLESRGSGDITALNDPKREKCGAPDYVVFRKRDKLTIGWVEAKDFGAGSTLDEVVQTEQLKRYFAHLPNLLVTDYLEVRWYVRRDQGVKLEGQGRLGRIAGSSIVSDPAEQEYALQAIGAFVRHKPARLTSAKDLAMRLADFTQMIRGIIIDAFSQGEVTASLHDWRTAFAQTLLPELAAHTDIDKECAAVAEFADMFAQTLTYGLFSARAAAPGGAFNRENARKLVPRTNPFLRNFFEQITGAALDDEPFAGFVEDIIQTLSHADLDAVLADFGTRHRRSDPVVHFYETFLQAYDPKLRELRGVYYTPEPVVNYIVESLDQILKEQFDIKEGLADRSKITRPRREGDKTISNETHRVLILDPATGTATFLYRVLDFIRQQFDNKRRAGAWGDYVHEHLLPRLFGFELLMAPYAVAHFKLGLALAARDEPELWRHKWSYEPKKDERINIFLTNTLEDLEETAEQLGPLRMLSNEANSAYEIKKNKPVLVILGNPPYSGHSANKGEWINSLIDDYLKLDGEKIKERNMKWVRDDYKKFIRWAQWRITTTGQGVLGFITNNGYLSDVTMRGMRRSLMQAFDEIYILDLHGNTNKGEIDPSTGAPDKNVFDIKQGVSIALFVKLPARKASQKECVVRHADLYGSQQSKYGWLDSHHVARTRWSFLEPNAPNYFFFPRDTALVAEYEKGLRITEIFGGSRPEESQGKKWGLGVITHNDGLLVDFDRKRLEKRFKLLASDKPDREIERVLDLTQTKYWNTARERSKVRNYDWKKYVLRYLYRPFDERWIVYEPDLMEIGRGGASKGVMHHLLQGDNLALLTTRQTNDPFGVLSTKTACAHKSLSAYDGTYVFPLYSYSGGKLLEGDLFARGELHRQKRSANISVEFVEHLAARLNVKFVPDGLGKLRSREVGPELIFNYAYAVFHSPTYRARYAEFLRTDFPRLPVTSDYQLFRELTRFGAWLVDLHVRNQADGSSIGYPINGADLIEQIRHEPPVSTGEDRHAGRVWINRKQYFEGVSPLAWDFAMGGYLPAQRWLKDRKGRTLTFEDKEAYPRIIAALVDTAQLMNDIDAAIGNHGGWPNAFA